MKVFYYNNSFHKEPYGRYRSDAEGCERSSGQTFREEVLAPALRENESVLVDLTGYNRYGRSFLDEAFGGLIREEGFTGAELSSKLKYIHRDVKSIIPVIDERIDAAIRDTSS
jgi:hypothetical protein